MWLSSGRAIIDGVAPRALLLASALAGPSLLVSACGGVPSSHASAQSAQQNAALAYSRCMRSHGVQNFPDPDAQGDFPDVPPGVPKQTFATAKYACVHLLSHGGGGGAETGGDQLKLTFALKVARCMRSHGFPRYPDPTTSSQGSGTRFDGTGIDTKSPQFQTAEIGCEKQERKALGLP